MVFSILIAVAVIVLVFALGVVCGCDHGSSDAFLRGFRAAENEYAAHRDSRGRFVKR